VQVLLDTLTASSLLFVVALGLLMVFGVLKIINFAHVAFLTLGAYASVVTTRWGVSPWLAFLVAPLAGAALGVVVERLVIRRLYSRPMDTVLATWGLTIVMTQLIILLYGNGPQFVNTPDLGTVRIADFAYSGFRIAVVAVALMLGLGLALLMRRTDLGLRSRAVIMNEELASVLGINTERVRMVTFTLGCALAAFAGAMLAPLGSVDPNLGLPWLITAFMLALIAGGSLGGLAVAAVLFGAVQTLMSTYGDATLAAPLVVIVAVLVLRVRPQGFQFA
jgi:branched-subunit amino acid ABC-type transport system permease component